MVKLKSPPEENEELARNLPERKTNHAQGIPERETNITHKGYGIWTRTRAFAGILKHAPRYADARAALSSRGSWAGPVAVEATLRSPRAKLEKVTQLCSFS